MNRSCEVDESHSHLQGRPEAAAGVTVLSAPHDVGCGARDFAVFDPGRH
jgi:hypothetical protein